MASKQIHVRLAGALAIPLLLLVAACDMTPGAQSTTHSRGTPTASGVVLQGSCGQFPQLRGAREGIEILGTDFPDSAWAVVATGATASTTAVPFTERYTTPCTPMAIKPAAASVTSANTNILVFWPAVSWVI